jgi:putative MATE family efflux protein
MLMGNADTLMLSQYSDESVASVGVANQILSLVIVMFGFIATGTSILIAQSLGANDRKSAGEVAVISLVVNLAFGLFMSVLLYTFDETILGWMNLPKSLQPDASTYFKIVGGFVFFESLTMTIGTILRSHGFTKESMFVTIGMNVTNVIGNYLFIFGPFGIPVLGVEGVAISTTTSRFLGLAVSAFLLWKRLPHELPIRSMFKLPRYHLKNILKIGIPSAGEQLSYNGAQMVVTYFVTTMGAEALTTKVITQNLMSFVMLFSIAIGQGTLILIGYMIGAKEYQSAYHRCLKSLKWGMSVAAVIGVAFAFSSHYLLGFFTDNPAIIGSASVLVWLTILLEPGRSFNLIVISALRAAGDVKFPVYIGIVVMWGVGIVVAYVLGIGFALGLIGIWLSFIADEWIRGLFMLRRWRKRAWVRN